MSETAQMDRLRYEREAYLEKQRLAREALAKAAEVQAETDRREGRAWALEQSYEALLTLPTIEFYRLASHWTKVQAIRSEAFLVGALAVLSDLIPDRA